MFPVGNSHKVFELQDSQLAQIPQSVSKAPADLTWGCYKAYSNDGCGDTPDPRHLQDVQEQMDSSKLWRDHWL